MLKEKEVFTPEMAPLTTFQNENSNVVYADSTPGVTFEEDTAPGAMTCENQTPALMTFDNTPAILLKQ